MYIYQFKDKARFLSNFHPCAILYHGVLYPSTEHAYQAQKSKSLKEKITVSLLDSPGKAKRHRVRFSVDKNWWEENKIRIMSELTAIKYSDANPCMREMLVETWPLDLVEGNEWGDTFWGVSPPVRGTGRNELGKILMQRRDEVMKL